MLVCAAVIFCTAADRDRVVILLSEMVWGAALRQKFESADTGVEPSPEPDTGKRNIFACTFQWFFGGAWWLCAL